MNKNNYIKAFTLFEMIIVMLLMSILIGGISWIFMSNQKLFHDTIADDARIVDHTTFLQVLKNDMQQSVWMEKQARDLYIESKTGNITVYQFENDSVIRVHPQSSSVFYEKFDDVDLILSNTSIILVLSNNETEKSLYFYKIFDVCSSINKEIFGDKIIIGF